MNRKLLISILLSIGFLGAYAQPQDLLAASGASFKNTSGYLTYSIGETVTATLTTPSAILTQGFLQTQLGDGVPVAGTPATHMSVFPNPVRNRLIIQAGQSEGFDYLLYDSRGTLLFRGRIMDERTEIDFSSLAPAVYILEVTNNKEELGLYQIIKY